MKKPQGLPGQNVTAFYESNRPVNRKVIALPGIAREVFTGSEPVYSSSLGQGTG
jgi:hypothetical protein